MSKHSTCHRTRDAVSYKCCCCIITEKMRTPAFPFFKSYADGVVYFEVICHNAPGVTGSWGRFSPGNICLSLLSGLSKYSKIDNLLKDMKGKEQIKLEEEKRKEYFKNQRGER